MDKKHYLLMNKNRPLLLFGIEDVLGTQECIELEQYQNIPSWISNINDWISKRNYAKHKEHFKRWLKEWGIDTTQGFLDVTHALCLNDTLWVKSEQSNLTWEQVNLYTNEFSDVAEHTAFETGLAGLHLTSTSPEMTAEGSFEKCWKREDGKIVIYKKGSSGFANAGLEPYSEYYASYYAFLLCDKSVSYDLFRFKGSLCTKCSLFTSEKVGFLPFYRVFDGKQITIAKALEVCSDLGFEEQFRQMIVLDSVIMNPDRHAGNFGFLIDNDTFDILDFAPVFDHNYSLLARTMEMDLCSKDAISAYLSSQGHKMGGAYLNVGKAILTPGLKERLSEHKDVNIRPHEKYNLPAERIETISSIVSNQIDQMLNEPVLRKIIILKTEGSSIEPEPEDEPEI